MINSSQNEKKDKRRIKKIFLLIVLILLTGTILVVETYAWFVGITTVSVNQFTVDVSSGEGLELSLDAVTWSSTNISVSESAVTTNLTTYSSNTNKWVSSSGLEPISTSGDISSGKLVLFGKGALASTGGGFRLISSQISNTSSEKEGYIAFDLFIRNGTGSQYIEEFNSNNDEAIYLSRDSTVIVTPNGEVTEDYGLANSVRVAFAQIGRVASEGTSASTAQGISCTSSSGTNPVTGLCTAVGSTIWEPNDTVHNANLISYFTNSCSRKTSATTYSGACQTLTNGTFFPTYTVKREITASNNVDIYDGAEINTYTASSTGGSPFISATDTFRDTEKNITGDSRQEFFRLAANSVTKIRIYVYLEGQDVDNYDLITKGRSIRIKFGLTKDKFEIDS